MQNAQMVLPISITERAGDHSLPVLVDALKRIVKDSEDDFMALGMNLQKVQMMSSAQRQKIAAAMGLFNGEGESGILPQISSYVQRSQQETRHAQQTAANLCTDLAGMVRLMDSIAQKTNVLERAGLFLHVIGINTGIECARYGQMEAMFKVVSQDTILLATQIRDTTNTLLDQTVKAKSEEEKTLVGAQKSIDSLQTLARQSNQATETALGKVGELVDYSISMVNEVERMSHDITAEINRVVMGIQFHDNLRQRVEHVNEVLLETGQDATNPSEEDLCNAYLSVALQQAQLEQLVGELGDLYLTQNQAVANILEAISHLDTRLESVATEQSQGIAQENPVEALLTGITALQELNRESLSLGREIRSSSERAEQIAGDMHTAIQGTFTIANSVKINALNAIIKAAKFGRIGESLQVLAQGMVDVSKDTRQLVQVFNELLGKLGKLVHNDENETPGQKDHSDTAEFDSPQMEQVFHRFREELLASKLDCQSLTRSLEREQRHLAFIAELKDAIQQQAEQLARYAETIRPQNEELLETLRNSFGKQLEARYTMNEEREIHNRLHQVETSPTDASPTVAGGNDDCLFFDDPAPQPAAPAPEIWGASQPGAAAASVELFSESSAEPAPVTPDEPELWGTPQSDSGAEVDHFERPAADTEPAAIELWDEPLAAAPDTGNEHIAEKEEFGDNIELF